jgi:diguanylate cyclase (GGDEF)-like protein/MYXO-CTERM domain-containing protein
MPHRPLLIPRLLLALLLSGATFAYAQAPGHPPPPPPGAPPPRPGMRPPPPPPRPMPAPHEMPAVAPYSPALAPPPEAAAPAPTAAHEARLLAARQTGQAGEIGAALMALAGEHSRLARDDLALPLWEEASRLANRDGDHRLGREAALAAAEAYRRRGDRALEQTWRDQADAYRERIASGITPPPPVVAPPAPGAGAGSVPAPAELRSTAPPTPEPVPPNRWPWLLVPLALGLLWAWRRSQHKAERLHEEAERLARHQRQLRTANTALQEQAAQLRQAAVQDALTGALSRTAFARQLEEALLHAAHYGKPVALMVFDLDHFKAINDGHGHLAGDAALRYVAGIVRENLRSDDLFGRFGGDEFLIGAADLDREQALALAEKIRSAAHLRAGTEDPRLAALSLSLGIAHADPGAGYSLELLFSRADAALYAAKRGGRNRSVLEDPSTPAPPRDQHAPRSLAPAS